MNVVHRWAKGKPRIKELHPLIMQMMEHKPDDELIKDDAAIMSYLDGLYNWAAKEADAAKANQQFEALYPIGSVIRWKGDEYLVKGHGHISSIAMTAGSTPSTQRTLQVMDSKGATTWIPVVSAMPFGMAVTLFVLSTAFAAVVAVIPVVNFIVGMLWVVSFISVIEHPGKISVVTSPGY